MAFPYVRHSADWKDAASATGSGDTSTPLTATALDTIEAGIDSLSDIFELADAAGDILVASAADTWARLAKGADDEVLSMASGSHDYRKIVNAMVDAAAAIAVSKLAAGSDGQFLKTVGSTPTWAAGATITAVTALPGSPADGDVIRFTDSLTAPTYSWLFQYEAEKATNKWQFIGGAPGYGEVTTGEATSTTGAYIALATAGPSFALPVAGDYMVEVGCTFQQVSGGTIARMSYDIGGTGAVDADAVLASGWGAVGERDSGSRVRKKAGLTAVTLTAKYKSEGGNWTFQDRWIRVEPVAIGG